MGEMLGRGGLAGYRCAEIACSQATTPPCHLTTTQLQLGVCFGDRLQPRHLRTGFVRFPLSEFMGLMQYRTVQKHAFMGPPCTKSVRIASCAHPVMPGAQAHVPPLDLEEK